MHAKSSRQTGSLRLLALSVSLSGASGFAFADTDLFFSKLPTVASISRLPQRQADAPAAVTVIDRAMIRASGARSLSDVFRLVPGFQTHAASDVAPRVNYHGVANDENSPRVQVLLDGRSLHSPLFRNGVNWSLIPVALEDIERIEVVRGSNTTSYGTNAFLGVINIITIDPTLAHGSSVSLSRGTQGVFDYTLRGAGAIGDATRFRITYQQQRDRGLDETPNERGVFDWRDRNRAKRLSAWVDHQVDFSNRLELALGRIEGERLRGRNDSRTGERDPFNPIRPLQESSTWFQARWLHTFTERSDLSIRYSYSVDSARSTFTPPTTNEALGPFGFSEVVKGLLAESIGETYRRLNEDGDKGVRHEIELTHNTLASDTLRLSTGASWRRDALRSETQLRDLGLVSRYVSRAFANAEWRPTDWLTGNAGASYEHDTFAGGHIAPRASIALHISPRDTLRFGYARAWRTASILDYKARTLITPKWAYAVGNRDLPAERLDSWEIGYLGDWRHASMSLDVRIFSEKLRDRMQDLLRTGDTFGLTPLNPFTNKPLEFTPTPYTTESVQHLHTRGYELQWRWQPLDATWIVLGHTNTRISARNSRRGNTLAANGVSTYARNLESYTEQAERSAPRRSTFVLVNQALPAGADLSVAWYRVGDIKWTRGTFAPGYERFDLRVAHPLRVGSQRGEIAYTAQSLKGAHFEQREQRVVDRRHWVTLRLDF